MIFGPRPLLARSASPVDRIAAGWACTDIGPATGFFFAECAGERVQVGIEHYDPNGPGHQPHSDR